MTDTTNTTEAPRKKKGPGSGKVAPSVVFNGSNILGGTPHKRKVVHEFSEELASRICAWLADGRSLRSFCLQEGTPDASTVVRWTQADAAFAQQYARAKDEGMDRLAELAVDEATSVLQAENVQAARLAFDARRWYASKVAAKRYGDKIDVKQEITGPGGGPLQIEVLLGQAISQPGFLDRFDDDEVVFITERIVPKLLAPAAPIIEGVAETVATSAAGCAAEAAGAPDEADGAEDAGDD